MDFEKFKATMKEVFENKYQGENGEVKVNAVQKNNIALTGICVVLPKTNITPTMYLEPVYDDYCRLVNEGTDDRIAFAKIAGDFVNEYDKHLRKAVKHMTFDVDKFTNWLAVKDSIIPCILNKSTNANLLNDTAYKDFCNGKYAIVFRYIVDDDTDDTKSILIRNDHVEKWGIDVDQLYNAAIMNDNLMPTYAEDINVVLKNMLLNQGMPAVIVDEIVANEAMPLYVLTNQAKCWGAAKIIMPGVLEKISDDHFNGESLYIIPSSIHEVLITSESELMTKFSNNGNVDEAITNLQSLVKEINTNNVADQDVLGEDLMFFDRTIDELREA